MAKKKKKVRLTPEQIKANTYKEYTRQARKLKIPEASRLTEQQYFNAVEFDKMAKLNKGATPYWIARRQLTGLKTKVGYELTQKQIIAQSKVAARYFDNPAYASPTQFLKTDGFDKLQAEIKRLQAENTHLKSDELRNLITVTIFSPE
jgi:hypothetical protein